MADEPTVKVQPEPGVKMPGEAKGGVLDGVNVVELDTAVAGSVAGMILADYGARVIKVEDPADTAALRENPGFAVWNRNKSAVTLPRSQRSESTLASLFASVDVCIVGGTVDYDSAGLARLNPLMVVAELCPYRGGAPWAGGEEDPSLLDALSGLSMRQSSFQDGPVDLVYPHTLYVQGLWGATCVTAALVERSRTGKGEVLIIDGLAAALIAGAAGFVFNPADAATVTPVGPGGASPCYTRYLCSDGSWLFLGALLPRFQRAAFEVLGLSRLPDDPRIAGNLSRILTPENRVWVRAEMKARFATQSRDFWIKALEEVGCPAGPVMERDTWLDHPQIVATGQRVEVDDPERGRVVMPGVLIDIPGAPGKIRSPAPRLAGTAADLPGKPPEPLQPRLVTQPEQRISRDHRSQPASRGSSRDVSRSALSVGPLDGIKVLNLGTILAGPLAGSLLAALGADVVKVEPPEGDAFRIPGFSYNRGMRSVAIDLRSEGGLEAFYRLASDADMVIDNYRHGVARRLRIDHATLRELNPALSSFSLTGFGETGPLATTPAFDPLLQAMSGMMSAQGGDDEPVFLTVAVNDVAAAVTAALATCLSLYDRLRTGRGRRTSTSLAAVSVFMQSGELVRFSGRRPATRGGRDFPGPSALDRYYRCADGWVRLRATGEDLTALTAVGLLEDRTGGDADGASDELGFDRVDEQTATQTLTHSFRSRNGPEIVAQLTDLGVKAVVSRGLADLAVDEGLRATDLFSEHPVADGSTVLTPGRWVRWDPPRPLREMIAPGLGQHTVEVLRNSGLAPSEIATLLSDGSVVQGGPMTVENVQRYR